MEDPTRAHKVNIGVRNHFLFFNSTYIAFIPILRPISCPAILVPFKNKTKEKLSR
jgi:hypothetical protein